MSLLDEILDKRKIKNREELSEQEKPTYDSIKKELETEVTVGGIKRFCESEIKILEREWLDMEYKGLTDLTIREKEIIIKARIKNYREILSIFSKVGKINRQGVRRAREILSK